jgi:hypothetical protein
VRERNYPRDLQPGQSAVAQNASEIDGMANG